MIRERYESSGPDLRLLTAARRRRPKRFFRSALGEGEAVAIGLSRQMLESYFRGPPEQEKQPLRYSMLIALGVATIAFFIVWPTIMKHMEIPKREETIHMPGQAVAALSTPVRKQQRKRVIREEFIPQLYPEVEKVEIDPDEDPELEIDDWTDLDINSNVIGVEIGYGAGGLGGPVLNAGVGDVPNPILIYKVEPDYPDPARRERVDGFVLLKAIVNKRGDVVDVEIEQSPPARYGFAEKAIAAVKQWKFKPAIYRGRPINVRIRFSVEFNLLY